MSAFVTEGAKLIFEKDTASVYTTYFKRVVICVSFFGFEDGEAIPPNIIMSGPFSDPPNDLLPILK